jgi:O-antigen/teichoic acid export membrane protein
MKNISPFAVSWFLAFQFSTEFYNQIFSMIAAIGFVSAVASLNLLVTTQSLYGSKEVRTEVEKLLYLVYTARLILFGIIGLAYYYFVTVQFQLSMFLIYVFVRMNFDFVYATFKIYSKFKNQFLFTFISGTLAMFSMFLVFYGILKSDFILIYLILSELITIVIFFCFHWSKVKFNLFLKVDLKDYILFVPGFKLLGASLLLPLINNTLYLNMIHMDLDKLAESMNFSMKIGLGVASIFSVFSNYLIQNTDWRAMKTKIVRKKLFQYICIAITVLVSILVSLFFLPLNQILFGFERFENFQVLILASSIICSLLIITSIVNQIRLQIGNSHRFELLFWLGYSIISYLIAVLIIELYGNISLAFIAVATIQFLTLLYLIRSTYRCLSIQ